MSDLEADYVVVGGGNAGLVVAHRLKKKLPTASIIVIEAGGDNSSFEHAQSFQGIFPLMLSPYNWALQTQSGLAEEKRVGHGAGGKAIGGSATINAGVWYRGPAADWNTWAELADDSAWRYENIIPFFKLAENLQDNQVEDKGQHAKDGYINVWSARARLSRAHWPLREGQQAAWKAAGVEYVPDPNNGQPNGLGEQFDVWDRGQRQFATKFLDLTGIQIISEIAVERITFDMPEEDLPKAKAVDLADGRCVTARKEIIVSSGTYNSPKLLLLSGIGDERTLAHHGIDRVYDNSHVGQNLMEHLCHTMILKLKRPEGLGGPALTGAEFNEGFPADFSHHGQVDRVREAQKAGASAEEQKYLSRADSSNIQTCLWYQPFAEQMTGIPNTTDGTQVSAVTCLVSPTSRGSVSLRSADPKDSPVVNQNFHATKADQFIMREGLKKTAQVFTETEAGKAFIQEQLVPEGFKPITSESADEDIDALVKQYAWSIQHPMGTCALGSVVDAHCRVKGVEGLRVVDASIMPTALGTNTQYAVYAIAERVAEWIGNGE